ncbi:hypothetical protein [Actinomyces wuliandei]|uniref:hypothetical protein n=1 Tax=Actinomyces wuliandei TaxID=2057743 RepID=UPI001FAA08E8|nr:hypothetical protein [Actinomyces wuliandei]
MSAGELLARSEEMLADWLREEGGQRVDIEFMGVGLVQQFDPQLTRGGQRSRVIPPHEVNSFMTELRDRQVVPGWGAWTWCRLWMVAGEWVLHQECDWMREPVLEGPAGGRPPPGICALELERHPRDAENIPDWMAAGVAANERRKAANARRREARRAKKERERQAAQAQAAEAADQQGGSGSGQTTQEGDGAGGSAG